MTKADPLQLTRYTLAIEELSMALGLINRGDLARELLKSVYDSLTEETIDARLTAASHSLLARGYCGISPAGTPVLQEELERAIFPLAKFDSLLQVSLVRGEAPSNLSIHVRRGAAFTGHMLQMGVIHLLEYAGIGALPGYLGDLFDGFGSGSSADVRGEVTPGLLSQALGLVPDPAALASLFTARGWDSARAGELAADFCAPEFRATLLRVEAGDGTPAAEMKSAKQRSLLLLKGKTRSWAFTFDGSGDDLPGRVRLVDRAAFEKILAEFVA
jgi:hypothetical protein